MKKFTHVLQIVGLLLVAGLFGIAAQGVQDLDSAGIQLSMFD